jgi:hypothetical protein
MRRDDTDGGTGLHDLFDSVRRSIFRPSAAVAGPEPPASPFGVGGGGIDVRISSCIRKPREMGLRGLITKNPSPPRCMLPPMPDEAGSGSGGGGGGGGCDGGGEENPLIRWWKGQLV